MDDPPPLPSREAVTASMMATFAVQATDAAPAEVTGACFLPPGVALGN